MIETDKNKSTTFYIISQVFDIYFTKIHINRVGNMPTIANRLKKIRQYYNYTQAQLGEKVNVTKQAIANIESGHSNPSIEFLSKLNENCNVNLNWFVTGAGYMLITPKYENIKDDILAEVEKLLKDKGL